jgi:diaminohydroxyphosphoribosylaminopyrimidine deaminase / 5-amino-6-(5-phosphoribosylamino)uracil reductase
MWSAEDSRFMLRALELAQQGLGHVEPNPLVGCVIVRHGQIVGEGWHRRFGEAHAEVEALTAAGERAAGGTLYVTLEPCCHHGKTPPCSEAIVAAGITRVVAAMQDPFPQVSGGGLRQLADRGIAVEVGLHEAEARALNAPYLKLLATGRPWIIAKWAMTLDGKIATHSGHSKWITSEASRSVVHRLRGRVDAILVGRRTAQLDDPLLTARPDEGQPAAAAGLAPPPRIATRIVLDSLARLASSSQLVRTARQYPTLIVAGPEASQRDRSRLIEAGCEVLAFAPPSRHQRLIELLAELGRRRMTNLLVEGGGELLGALLDARQIDEVHAFIAPKLFGGQSAKSPVGGGGVAEVADALMLAATTIEQLGSDLYIHGRVERPRGATSS